MNLEIKVVNLNQLSKYLLAGWTLVGKKKNLAKIQKVPYKSYEEAVSALIRNKYSLDHELAVLRQRETKPEEFAAYSAFAEEAKATARLYFPLPILKAEDPPEGDGSA